MKRLLLFVIILLSLGVKAQIDVSKLQSMGINSESDLKKLGLSDSDISNLKASYYGKTKQEPLKESQTEVKELPKVKEKLLEKPAKITSEEKKELPVFGQSVFKDGAVKVYKTYERTIAPDDYVLGAGDIINVTIWGYSEFSGEYTLDQFGNITPKLVGRVNLKGKTFSQVREIITSRFGKVYDLKNSQIAIELSYSKTISVNALGYLNRPGTYTMPSINSALGLLALAGGPTRKGSVRSIELRRGDGSIESIDVYEFMVNPNAYRKLYLEEGDNLFVPVLGNVVSISGEVIENGKFELKEGEDVNDLVSFAGGLKAVADSRYAHVLRLSNNEYVMHDIPLIEGKYQSFPLKNGDKVSFSKVEQVNERQITVKGQVQIPGVYEFVDGENIIDAIERSGGFNEKSKLDVIHIYRLKEDFRREVISVNVLEVLKDISLASKYSLKPYDIIQVFNKESFNDDLKVQITGLVRDPGSRDFKEGMTLQDLFVLSGGLKNEADAKRIEIERVKFDNVSNQDYVELLTVSLEKASSVLLMPYDIINVRRLPDFSFQNKLKIEGEVMYPGVYSISSKVERLSDILERSGGLTQWAFLDGASIYRKQDSIGLLALDLEEVVKNPKSEYNYIINPGDKITIPKLNDVITISGHIGYLQAQSGESQISAPYKKGKRVGHYIRKYGAGFEKGADRLGVYVVGYNGQVKKSTLGGLIRPKADNGDRIVVGKKEKKKEKKQKASEIDWNRQIESATVKITGILTLWVLVRNATGS